MWESVPGGWAIGRKGVGSKGGEFGARDVQAEGVGGRTKRAGRCVDME